MKMPRRDFIATIGAAFARADDGAGGAGGPCWAFRVR
jgi:hypothetical protein